MHDETDTDMQSLSFLVVDDDSFIQDMTIAVLGKFGVTDIATAANGKKALDHLDSAASPPDVMLIDIRMPEMDGVQLMNHLADRKYRGAIILVSGIDELTVSVAEGMGQMRDLNVLGHINKPITMDSLMETLKGLQA